MRSHERTRRRGVNSPVYWLVRAFLQPFLQAYFRLCRNGRHHIPAEGGVLLASNHRSFLDPFVIGCCLRRPIFFVAKQELFKNRLVGWFLNCLGAFPVRRGESDEESMKTALALLERGDAVVIFPEGTRIRRGALKTAKRGVGRLALQSGDPVVLAVPSSSLPQVVGSIGARIGDRSAVLALSKGLVQPLGMLPTRYVSDRVNARAVAFLGGPSHAAESVHRGAHVVLASSDEPFRDQLAEVLDKAGL